MSSSKREDFLTVAVIIFVCAGFIALLGIVLLKEANYEERLKRREILFQECLEKKYNGNIQLECWQLDPEKIRTEYGNGRY